jgi:soluble lytic murein transglycosylase
LAAWVADWSEQPLIGTENQVSWQEMEQSGFVQRAIALQAVGLRVEAINEWNAARDEWAADPTRLMLLARAAHEHTMPYIGLKTGEQLAALAPPAALPRPQALDRLIFPTPYADLFLQEAAVQGVDPRLVYALVRQESLFNPGATSWVGARGLAQVMPTTGEGIAQSLGVANFQVDDLYRPHISIRFGTFYVGQRIEDMNGSIHGGLAAYNGGLGNAARWANGYTVHDPDLYTESIDYAETRGYVRRVYGFYGAYQRLYTLP